MSRSSLQKSQVILTIRKTLQAELVLMVSTTKAALDEATGSESRAENQYDTRGLEASYLAGAMSERLLALKQLISFYGVFSPPDFGPDDEIRVGALIQLEENGRSWWCFMTPQGKGMSIEVDGEKIMLLSPRAPLGRALAGEIEGEEVVFETPRSVRTIDITKVL